MAARLTIPTITTVLLLLSSPAVAVVPCQSNVDCSKTEFCLKTEGDCHAAGVCTERPSVCPQIYEPVCGCDGQTYTNSCQAAAAGVSINYTGECTQFCGGIAGIPCGAGQYCDYDGCYPDAGGHCEPIPEICPPLWDPVCGCDGETYANACVAAAARMTVDYKGECSTTTPCASNLQCPSDSYCAKAAGDCDGSGQCLEKPVACPEIYDPVCGCNGTTYSNSCYAAAAGVNVDYAGQCTKLCGTIAGIPCGAGEYCNLDGCYPDAAGHCDPVPNTCPDVWQPVCGCDGVTYGNACEAAMARMTVDHDGECSTTTPCTENTECKADSYCAKAEGDCDGNGQCLEKPVACPEIYDPVCGCDGTTYSNSCEAAAAGVNVNYSGQCSAFCGGIAGIPCPAGEYCNLEGCYPDAPGQCEPVPLGCPDVWDPVCGCDGVTYGNACEAAMAQMTVDHDGECSTTTPCTENAQCQADSYCAKTDGDCDGQGQCRERPLTCPDVWEPVCGCDGVTYGNACEAAMAQMTVGHEGECSTTTPCTDNSECPADAYCAKAEGDCDGRGECREKPIVCPDVWAPVCGCDGRTYGNDCEAAMAGTNVDYDGECLPPGPTIVMLDPNVASDDVHTGPSGIKRLRILWSEPIVFSPADVTVFNEHGNPILFSIAGNNTEITAITFAGRLIYDIYTVTIADSAISMITGVPIDGDNNGAGRGDAVMVMEHRLRTDADNNNRIDFRDVALWADTWLAILD